MAHAPTALVSSGPRPGHPLYSGSEGWLSGYAEVVAVIWWKFFIRLGVLALCASVASGMAGEQYLEYTIRSGSSRQFTLQQLQAVSATSAMFGALFGLAGVEFILARHQAKEDRDRMVRLLMAQAKRLDISPEVAAASVYLANDLTEVPNER